MVKTERIQEYAWWNEHISVAILQFNSKALNG